MSVHEIKEFRALTGLKKPYIEIFKTGVAYDVVEATPVLIVGSDPDGANLTRLDREELALKYTKGIDTPIDESSETLKYILSYVDFKEESVPTRRVRLRIFHLELVKKPDGFFDYFRKREKKIITVATLRHYTDDVLKHRAVVLVKAGENTPLEVITRYGKRVNKNYVAACKRNEVLDDGVFVTTDTLGEIGGIVLSCGDDEDCSTYTINMGGE